MEGLPRLHLDDLGYNVGTRKSSINGNITLEPTAMHLDQSKLDELAELADGDLEFVADLLETYLDDALPRVASLSEALATGNQDSAAALAHALKSGSANIGANIAAGHFEAIEEAGRAGSMDKITSSLASWESDFTATVDAIKNWLASNNSEE